MLTLVLGGARSGKSRYARSLVEEADEVIFVATATVDADPEMRSRIERHRAERPSDWRTIEEPLAVVSAVREAEPRHAVVLVDCVTIWLSNLLFEHRSLERAAREARILEDVASLAAAARTRHVIAVSNEVGGGVVPDSALGREFRDLQGLANQTLAREAERVVLVVAGIPTPIKSGPA